MVVVVGGFSPEKPVLAPDFLEWLAENNPIGATLTEADVSAWWDLAWPTYSTRGYTNHKRAITSWWSRVREEEIEKARERAQRIRDELEAIQLEGYRAVRQLKADQDVVPLHMDHRRGRS